MTDAERMKEMEELLREARAKICGGFSTMNKQNFHERLNTILDPPSDPDALAKYFLSITVPESVFECLSDAAKHNLRTIAAWVEADRVATWNAAIDAVWNLPDGQTIHSIRKPILASKP